MSTDEMFFSEPPELPHDLDREFARRMRKPDPAPDSLLEVTAWAKYFFHLIDHVLQDSFSSQDIARFTQFVRDFSKINAKLVLGDGEGDYNAMERDLHVRHIVKRLLALPGSELREYTHEITTMTEEHGDVRAVLAIKQAILERCYEAQRQIEDEDRPLTDTLLELKEELNRKLQLRPERKYPRSMKDLVRIGKEIWHQCKDWWEDRPAYLDLEKLWEYLYLHFEERVTAHLAGEILADESHQRDASAQLARHIHMATPADLKTELRHALRWHRM